MITTIAVLSFMLGMIFGVFLVAGIVAYQIYKLEKQTSKDFDKNMKQFSEDMENVAFVKVQFKEVNKITDEQMELLGALDRPNASASHSRHKNQILQQVKDLEARKVEIFKSILDTGLDPVITMFTPEEGKIEMRMSEALKRRGDLPADNTADTQSDKTDSNSPRGKVVPLRLVKEENTNEPKSDDP